MKSLTPERLAEVIVNLAKRHSSIQSYVKAVDPPDVFLQLHLPKNSLLILKEAILLVEMEMEDVRDRLEGPELKVVIEALSFTSQVLNLLQKQIEAALEKQWNTG